MGYAGGSTKDPTYHNLGDHSETLQLDYDPSRIDYGRLLVLFWQSHDPSVRQWSRQYMPVVFYHNEGQRRLAEESKKREEEKRGIRIFTQIVPYKEFHRAEDYHQKYYLRSVPELKEHFAAMYPDEKDFMNSTAAARVNGYLGGYGDSGRLAGEVEKLGLTPQAEKRLAELVRSRSRR